MVPRPEPQVAELFEGFQQSLYAVSVACFCPVHALGFAMCA